MYPYDDCESTYTPPPYVPVVLPVFTTPDELKTHIFENVVVAISDGDTSLMVTAIAAAESEAAGYMDRYDYVTIFTQTGTNRDPILLQTVKTLAVWHFIGLANPNIDYEVWHGRYKEAVRWLEKVQDSRVNPVGWPISAIPQLGNLFHSKSRRKRGNNY